MQPFRVAFLLIALPFMGAPTGLSQPLLSSYAFGSGIIQDGHPEIRLEATMGIPVVGLLEADDVILEAGFWWSSMGVVGTSTEPIPDEIPQFFRLGQNYPNPFNPQTSIAYTLPNALRVTLTVLDSRGIEVARLVDFRRQPAGRHTVVFDARDLPSGVYFYRIVAGRYTETDSMVLLK